MLRITVERKSTTATLTLAGRLAGPWVQELHQAWADLSGGPEQPQILVDLSDVTFVAPECRTLLESMYQQGARFKTSGCFGTKLVEEIVQSVCAPRVNL